MKRREVIGGLCAALLQRSTAGAQGALPVIGFLSSRSPAESAHLVAAFRLGLQEAGFVEGRNVQIEYRWAEGSYDRLREMATELAQRPVSVIATAGGTPSALAAKAATSSIPIVFLTGGDPIKLGLVESLNRPGRNATGVGQFATILAAKRLELLRELVPSAFSVMHLFNPKNRSAEIELADVRQAARALRLEVNVQNASSDAEIEGAFENLSRIRPDALLVMTDPFFDSRRERLVALTMRHAVPAIYGQREYAIAGGLMSYGTNFADTYRQAGAYVARVLAGAKPADLPVVQPTKFELVINLRTAKALGLSIPLSIQAQADEVIE
jgi:putative tryptophan/tyrosine transport system substrate-binding protein